MQSLDVDAGREGSGGSDDDPIIHILNLGTDIIPDFSIDLAMNQSAAQKELFAGEIYKKRYRNFFTLPLYWVVMGFFLWLGTHYKARFSPITWYVFVGMVGFFLFLSFFWLTPGCSVIFFIFQ
jgi:hypothetical protein